MLIQVEKLVYGGDGLSRDEGEVVLTPYVLAGETVEAVREPNRSGIARARLVEVVTPSADRVVPPCPYFGRCGGCHYQHGTYAAQLAAKRSILKETLRRTGKLEALPPIETIAGEPWAYRNRIQLHFDGTRLGYREARSHQFCAIDRCPISSPKLNECIGALNRMMREGRRWPSFLKAAELFTNETDVQFHVLQTQRPLARKFFDWLGERIPGLVSGALDYAGFRVSYDSFFQVNRFLIGPLVEAALGEAKGNFAVDLYAGVGLFSLPLASKFARVTAVESGKSATHDLAWNAERASAPIDCRAESAERFLASLNETPDFVLADPPRAGIGNFGVRRLSELRPQMIVVVACDPTTLARDAQKLVASGYKLVALTLIDLFPQTYHVETIARFLLT